MKSRKALLRVLLDTSFILPTLGIDVGEEALMGLRKLTEVKTELYYSRFSILESLWIAARLSKKRVFDMERFSQGLRSILEGHVYKRVEEDSQILRKALELRMLGHMDMIDNILYASSTSLNLKLLTLDTELETFIREKGLKNTLLFPSQIT
ncbi:PIN domain-containing protein [Candidatus Bathyarchaeota archaeon]|nr:PIN domain-containing protein [Candidatus Bathyarchaeota archaeon]